jgi:apolipoprotein N-acyltransferase
VRRTARALGRLALALVPALLMGAYARWPALLLAPYITLAPWVVLYTDDREPRASLGHFVVSTYVAGVLIYTVGFRFAWFVPLVFAPALGLFWSMLLFAPVLRAVHRRFRLPRALSVPVVWVGVEWFRATFTLAHFDLFQLGYSQARWTGLVQIADLVGAYGVSFLVAAVNGLLADAWFALRERGWAALAADRRLLAESGAVAAAFGLALAYGGYRMGAAHEEGPRLALVQPNARHWTHSSAGAYLAQWVLTDREVPRGAADLIVWPENAILDELERDGAYLEELGRLAEAKQARILLGAMGRSEEQPGRATNAAFLVGSAGEVLGRYDKQILFPWSEYVPLDGLLRRFLPSAHRLQRELARRAWGHLGPGVAGRGTTLLTVPWRGAVLPFAVLICVENVHAPVPAEGRRRGARFLVNITSEGSVAGPIQEQLLRVCILRAVENRVAYVRVGNTGISAVIDPEGRVRGVLRDANGRAIGAEGVRIERVPLSSSGPTLHARSRDGLARACAALTLALWLGSWVRRAGRAGAAAALALVVAACAPVPRVGRDPQQAAAALARGRDLFEQKPRDCDAAIPALARACAEPEACASALPYLAECFLEGRQFEAAVEFFGEVAGSHPGLRADALAYRGHFLDKGGYPAEAVAAMQESVALAPSARVLAWLARLEARLGQRETAIARARAGLRLAPDDLDLRLLLAMQLRQDGRFEEARVELDRILERDPARGAAWVTLGQLRAATGDPDGALAAYRRAIEVDPRNILARFMIAKRALREHRLEEAQQLLAEIQQLEAALGRGPRED